MRQYSSVEYRTVSDAWTAEEHERFLIGLERCRLYGKNQIMSQGMWQIILEAVGATKSLHQVQEHAQNYFMQLQALGTKKNKDFLETASLETTWTMEEEKRFEEILSKWRSSDDYCWQEISNALPGRSLEEVKERYKKLCNDVRRIEQGNHVTAYYSRYKRPYTAVSIQNGDEDLARMQQEYLDFQPRSQAYNHNNVMNISRKSTRNNRRETFGDRIILSKEDQRYLFDAVAHVQAISSANSPAVAIVNTAVNLLLRHRAEIREGFEARITLDQAYLALEKLVSQLELQGNSGAPVYHLIVNELVFMLGLADGPMQSQPGLIAPLSVNPSIYSGRNYLVHPMPNFNTLNQCEHLHQFQSSRQMAPSSIASLAGRITEEPLANNASFLPSYHGFDDGCVLPAALYHPLERD